MSRAAFPSGGMTNFRLKQISWLDFLVIHGFCIGSYRLWVVTHHVTCVLMLSCNGSFAKSFCVQLTCDLMTVFLIAI